MIDITDTLAIWFSFVLGGIGVLYSRIVRIERKLDLILRKLNNSHPDDEGGY